VAPRPFTKTGHPKGSLVPARIVVRRPRILYAETCCGVQILSFDASRCYELQAAIALPGRLPDSWTSKAAAV